MPNWKEKYQTVLESKSPVKFIIGVLLIIYGIFALLTPFTPGSWLTFFGLELLGFRLAVWDKIKNKIFKK